MPAKKPVPPQAPRAENLVGLVAYQNKTVVSRTVIQKKTGTVTLFAFDRGEGLSEHTAPFAALVVVLDGAANITVGGKKFKVATGETITLPPGVPHALKAVTRFKMMLVMIRE